MPDDKLLNSWTAEHLDAARAGYDTLTPHDFDIIDGSIRGLTAEELGRVLQISRRTVELHRQYIAIKMHARNSLEAMALIAVIEAERRQP